MFFDGDLRPKIDLLNRLQVVDVSPAIICNQGRHKVVVLMDNNKVAITQIL
jgi:hypothetical protein